jgi:tetratricopeptide (TPR) repeat protein
MKMHTKSVYCFVLCLTFVVAADIVHDAYQAFDAGDFKRAYTLLQHAHEQIPQEPKLLFELAHSMSALGLFDQAATCYQRIIATIANNADLYHNLGYCLRCAGRFQEAICAYKQAVALDPNKDASHFGLAMAYIFQGDFERGWKLHERFLNAKGRNAHRLRSWFANKSLAGKTILLKPEGGLGDTIQFVRYARELKKYGLTVIVATQPQLYKLLARCPYIDHLISTGQQLTLSFDDWTTLMSMAPILYSIEHQIPAFSPYIWADPNLVKQWEPYFAHETNLKVGVSWQASVHNDTSRPAVARRGIPLSELLIIGQLPQISMYSLQQEDGLEQLRDMPSYAQLHQFDATFDKEHGAFEDSAAVLEHLDLLITVDSALAHLAGAMGKEVWLLLPYATDWRWVHNATTSVWYPSMRIFKQTTPFDWQEVMERVVVALMKKIAARRT